MELAEKKGVETRDDVLILGRKEEVRGWNFISTDVEDLADVDDEIETKGQIENSQVTEPSEAVVGNEVLKETEGTAEQLSRILKPFEMGGKEEMYI